MDDVIAAAPSDGDPGKPHSLPPEHELALHRLKLVSSLARRGMALLVTAVVAWGLLRLGATFIEARAQSLRLALVLARIDHAGSPEDLERRANAILNSPPVSAAANGASSPAPAANPGSAAEVAESIDRAAAKGKISSEKAGELKSELLKGGAGVALELLKKLLEGDESGKSAPATVQVNQYCGIVPPRGGTIPAASSPRPPCRKASGT